MGQWGRALTLEPGSVESERWHCHFFSLSLSFFIFQTDTYYLRHRTVKSERSNMCNGHRHSRYLEGSRVQNLAPLGFNAGSITYHSVTIGKSFNLSMPQFPPLMEIMK